MIINKPQFDEDNIKPGEAYNLTKKDYRHYNEINTPCIIKKVKPLTIVVSYYSNKKEYIEELTIDIKSFVDGTFALEKMVIETKKMPPVSEREDRI